MIRKNVVNGVSDFVIALVSPRSPLSSEDFTQHCYSDGLKRPKGMTVKTVGFCQDSNNVNNHYRGREKNNTLQKGFNDHHIKSTCFISTVFWELLLLLIFKNNNLFNDRDLACSSNRKHNFCLTDQFYKIIGNVNSCLCFFTILFLIIYLGILNCLRTTCIFMNSQHSII